MTTIKNYRLFAIALLALIMVSAATPIYAQTYSVMYDFGNRNGDPWIPNGAIAQGRDGGLYTTSGGSGINGRFGTVFKITPEGTLRVLYYFCSQAICADGSAPNGGLTIRPDGNLIGTTQGGGNNDNGTIFDITPSGSLTVLYKFTGGLDGSLPNSAPVMGTDGSFYGVAEFGGRPSHCGTIYRITGNVFAVLHDFDNLHGCNPIGPLVLGTDGNFYGTTVSGGTAGSGVVYQLTLRPGKAAVVTVLANFDATTGGQPFGPLVQASDGNFYGTTSGSSTNNDFGTVFKITPTGTLTVVHTLNGTTDGRWPYTGLVQATDGNFYGAASQGGNSSNCSRGCGALFQVTPTGNYSVLYNFDGTTGSSPISTLFQHTNGLLYGDTDFGGTGSNAECIKLRGCGVFYSWDAGLPAFVSTVPFIGKPGSFVEILGQDFTSTTTVSFNGTPATATVVSGTYLRTTVPAGATTGSITVTTSGGTLTSNRQFVVTP